MMIKTLQDMVYTTVDAALLKQECGLLQAALYRVNHDRIQFEQTLKREVRTTTADLIVSLQQDLQQAPDKVLEKILQELDQLEALQLYLPVEPSQVMIEHLANWTRDQLGQGVVLELLHDHQLLAGVRIIYKGKYLDYSLNKVIHSRLPSMIEEAYAAISNAA